MYMLTLTLLAQYLSLPVFIQTGVVVVIRDKGVGIPDIQAAMTPLFTTAPEQERAGLGFAVMQSFMDKVKVRSVKGKGTTVTMEKRLRSREENQDARHGN